MRQLILLIVLILLTPAVQADEIIYETIVDDVGDYVMMDASLRVSVFEQDEQIQFRIHGFGPEKAAEDEGFGPEKAIIEKESNWFIYPESDTNLWIYLGDGTALHYEWISETESKAHRFKTRNEIESRTPKIFYEIVVESDDSKLK